MILYHSIGVKTMRAVMQMKRAAVVLSLFVFAFSTVQAMAATGFGESGDFTVNTVPEPVVALVALAVLAFCAKRRG